MKHGKISFLPQEIITNILQRLPVKSLIRFQCVCKDWKDLFRTSSFVGEHLSPSRNNPYLLFESSNPHYRTFSSFLDHHMNLVGVQSLPLIDSSSSYARIVGSINGLICVRTFLGLMIIWNPSIGESIHVPEVNNNSSKSCISFGFDSTVNDYKIVKISNIDYIEKVQVYSMSTETWKDVKFGNLDDLYHMPNDFQICVKYGVALCSEFYSITSNGAIFWRGNQNEVSDCVVSFDLALEVFTVIPIPFLASNASNNKLVVFQNNELAMLSVSRCDVPERYFVVDMWVMQESVSESGLSWNWIKKYSISPFPYLLAPRLIWKNVIVCDINLLAAYFRGESDIAKRKIVIFNLDTQDYKMVDRIDNIFDPVFIHVESLVSVHCNHLQKL